MLVDGFGGGIGTLNMAVRSSSGASSRPELVPQQLQKVDAGTLKYERYRVSCLLYSHYD
jgi:hypothetical protein